MSESSSFENPQRNLWTDFLINTLQQPEQRKRHGQAALLLGLFGTSSRRHELEAMLLDGSRNSWVRTALLRAMVRRRIPMTPSGFRDLLGELARDLSRSAREERSTVSSPCFADVRELPTVGRLAGILGEHAVMARFIQSLDGEVVRDLLKAPCGIDATDLASMRDTAYRRAIESGVLDCNLAWRTFDYAESRSFLFGSCDDSVDAPFA